MGERSGGKSRLVARRLRQLLESRTNYLAKLLSPKMPRRLGMYSMAGVLAVLGVELVMVESRQALERCGSRIPKHNKSFVQCHRATECIERLAAAGQTQGCRRSGRIFQSMPVKLKAPAQAPAFIVDCEQF